MKLTRRYFVLAALIGLSPLTSCGGGGSSSNSAGNSPPPPPPAVNQAPSFSSAPTAQLTENTTQAFYTVSVNDPDSTVEPTVSLVSTGDGQFFEYNSLTNLISARAGLDFELPADEDGNGVYDLTFQATDGEDTTSFNVALTITDVFDDQSFGLSPTAKPSDNFDLADWKLDTPFNDAGGFEEDTLQAGVQDYEIAGYEHPIFFHTGADGGLVMRSPVYGAKTSIPSATSSGARYTRTELREMLRAGDRSISTRGDNDAPNKNNWVFSSAPQSVHDQAGGVDGKLRVTLAVNSVTTTGENFQIGRVIIGQIHAKDDEPIRLYYRKLPGNTHGSIYAQHEPVGEDDINFNMLGSSSSSQSNPVDGLMLGEIFTYEIEATGNFLDVTILQGNMVLAEQEIDMTGSGYDVADDFMYFKAGVYHVNDSAHEDEFAQITIYELENTH